MAKTKILPLLYKQRELNEKRLLLVDGHGLLFQMFFGIPARVLGKNNKVITGTIGFVSTLLKMINMLGLTHMLVVFDAEQHLNNKNFNQEYKANRPDWANVEPEQNPFSQLEDIEKTLEFLNISYIYSANGLEADDYIYTIAKKYQTDFDVLFLLSKDTDFYQMLSSKVLMVKYSGKNTRVFSEKEVIEHIGVHPNDYAFYKTLTGDSADNIKGVAGVGKITAKNLVNEHKTISRLYQNMGSLSPRLQASLKDQRFILENNLRIITFDAFDLQNIPLENLEILQEIKTLNAGHVLRQLNIL